jgi:hypothetical protein
MTGRYSSTSISWAGPVSSISRAGPGFSILMSIIKIFIQNIKISFDLNGCTHRISSHHVKHLFQNRITFYFDIYLNMS